MAKFNIYKIKNTEEMSMLDRFDKVGLKKQDTKIIDGYELTFYFSTHPDEVDIWWVSFYKDFLSPGLHELKNEIYYAVLHIKKDSIVYVVSLGKSHFYIKDYCDQNFGLDLAERIANSQDVKIKNTKFFKSKRNKVITSYQNNSSIDFESGESMHFLKARSVNSEKWGKTVNFGQSVLLNLDLDYTHLPKIIDDIECELKLEPKIFLPKVVPVTDDKKILGLDSKLLDAIHKNDLNGSVEETQFSLHGVDFVFSGDYEYSFFLSGNSKNKSEKGPLDIERFREFLKIQPTTISRGLDELKVIVHKDHGRDHSENFKNFLEYVDTKEKVCLIDGKWYEFNQSYIKYLRQEIDSIECEIKVNVEQLPLEKDYLDMMEKDGFVIIHTRLETLENKYYIEAGDMIKDNTLYVVKRGKIGDMNYAIDQAIASVLYLQENNNEVVIDGNKYQIKNISLSLLLRRKTNLKHLFDLDSIIFHMKMIDWQRIARSARFNPVVLIEQYKG